VDHAKAETFAQSYGFSAPITSQRAEFRFIYRLRHVIVESYFGLAGAAKSIVQSSPQ
jgi:hypothetical protein